MNRTTAKFLFGMLAPLFVTTTEAQQGKMLSDGENFALRSVENVPGQGLTGTFVYRRDPKGSVRPGEWDVLMTMSCSDILQRRPLVAAMQIQVGVGKDLPTLTGATWAKLEEDIFKGMSKFHDLCNATSSLQPPLFKVKNP